MAELYFTWDGRPAPSAEEADWIVLAKDTYEAEFSAIATWEDGINVGMWRERQDWAECCGFNWMAWKVRAWPTVFDVNTLAEMLIAREYIREPHSFNKFLEKPFKPSSLYGKPEGLSIEVLVEKGGAKEARVVGPDELTPLFVRVPVGWHYGCYVYDAWGRRAELRLLLRTEIPKEFRVVEDIEIYEGEAPGAGWVVCWIRSDTHHYRFYAYANIYGYVRLVRGYVKNKWYGKKITGIWAEDVWTPNFNQTLADILIQGEETA